MSSSKVGKTKSCSKREPIGTPGGRTGGTPERGEAGVSEDPRCRILKKEICSGGPLKTKLQVKTHKWRIRVYHSISHMSSAKHVKTTPRHGSPKRRKRGGGLTRGGHQSNYQHLNQNSENGNQKMPETKTAKCQTFVAKPAKPCVNYKPNPIQPNQTLHKLHNHSQAKQNTPNPRL